MSDTGWLSPTTGPANWTNGSNVTAQDGTNATSTATNGETGFFHAYGYSGLSVPAGATINGIEVRMYGSTTLTPDYSYFNIGSNSGAPLSVTQKSIALPVDPTAASYVTMGSTSDLWGGLDTPRAWLPADFDSTFDVAGAWGATAATMVKIDNIQIRVTYTPAAAGVKNSLMMLGCGI